MKLTRSSLQQGTPLPGMQDRQCAEILALAQQIQALDLLITVDSMPAHLGGALGVPTWVLLPREADWRWLDDRSDSPWYSSVRLFRQVTAGDWERPLAEVRAALCRLVQQA